MIRLGIVPAAGVGSRWGYFPKFLLPCGEREWLLDRTIKSIPAETSIVVYSTQTFRAIKDHIGRCGLDERVILKEQTEEKDIWGAILAALVVEADYYYFAMPDTYFDPGAFKNFSPRGLSLGVFHTDKPERFGVIRNGTIINKQSGEPGQAWGTFGVDKYTRDLWLDSPIGSYTEALNFAIRNCKTTICEMQYYKDMANWNDYVEFIKRVV